MVAVEYLGGLPERPDGAQVMATVDAKALHLKRRGFLHGWSSHLPLGEIASVELTTADEIRAKGVLPSLSAPLPDHDRDYFLAIEATPEARAVSIILRGPWAAVDALRQEILRGRQRAGKQWRS